MIGNAERVTLVYRGQPVDLARITPGTSPGSGFPDAAMSTADSHFDLAAPHATALVGGIAIGGGAPIVVQSMTNTDTADVAATVDQVKALAEAGSELVRSHGEHRRRGRRRAGDPGPARCDWAAPCR